MRWRLFMSKPPTRWLSYPGPEELAANPADWGLDLPEGARIHSIAPLVKQSGALDDDFSPRLGLREEVLEWAVFVAVPFDEEETP